MCSLPGGSCLTSESVHTAGLDWTGPDHTTLGRTGLGGAQWVAVTQTGPVLGGVSFPQSAAQAGGGG